MSKTETSHDDHHDHHHKETFITKYVFSIDPVSYTHLRAHET